MKIENRYLDGSYLQQNPDWDRADAYWKAEKVFDILSKYKIKPNSICEVGCGSGDILRSLSTMIPNTKLFGYDVSPQLIHFWEKKEEDRDCQVEFKLGSFHEINHIKYDVLLMLDVFEHVRDPFTFLENSLTHATTFIFHVPLDLSAVSVARKNPLLAVRRSVGHLHFYTKDLAIETLEDCGYRIIGWQYSGASLSMANRSLITKLAGFPRRIMGILNKDFAVRLFGGETLFLIAEKNNDL